MGHRHKEKEPTHHTAEMGRMSHAGVGVKDTGNELHATKNHDEITGRHGEEHKEIKGSVAEEDAIGEKKSVDRAGRPYDRVVWSTADSHESEKSISNRRPEN